MVLQEPAWDKQAEDAYAGYCCWIGAWVQYTNYSLRAIIVTRMYNTGVPEKLIAEKSGHKCLKAVHVYECTSKVQEKSAG